MMENRVQARPALRMLFGILLFAAIVAPAHAAVWYVNDTSTVGDSFTSAVGYDTQAGTSALPKRTITAIMALVAAGDTVYIDAGTYKETVVIPVNNLTLRGVDSSATIIDPANEASGVKGIYATAKSGLLIQNLCVQNAYAGIEWNNVGACVIKNVKVFSNGTVGIYFWNGTNNVTVTGCDISSNSSYGVFMNSGINTFTSCRIADNLNYNVYLTGSSNNVFRNNIVTGSLYGFFIYNGSIDNIIDGNEIRSATYNGIYMRLSCDNNAIIRNLITGNNGAYGAIYLADASYNRIELNRIVGNYRGPYFDVYVNPSEFNTVRKNNIFNNTS